MRGLVLLMFMMLAFTACTFNNSSDNADLNYSNIQGGNMTKNIRIAMIIAPRDFQDTEFKVPYEYFERHGASVDVYSTKIGPARGAFGTVFMVNKTLSELDVNDYDAIVYIGGSGTPVLRADDNSERIAEQAMEKNKVIGAICWSPTILAKAGILKGKNATVWDGDDSEYRMLTSEYLEEQGAKYTGEDVTIDGNIITADGPSSAQKYAEEIWKKIIK